MAEITLAPSAEDVPMASMLAEMLRANLEGKPEKTRVFEKLKARVYLFAQDAETGMTMEFDRGKLTVHGGQEGKPDISIATDSATLLELANIKIKMGIPWYFDQTGREVVKKMFKGELKIKGMFSHLGALTKVTKVMSVN